MPSVQQMKAKVGLGGADGNLSEAAAGFKSIAQTIDEYIKAARKKVKVSYDEAIAELERRNVDKATVSRVKNEIANVKTRAEQDAANFGLQLKNELERQERIARRTAG